MPTGAAIVGGAIISGRASGKASDAASDAAAQSGRQIQQAGEQARRDVLDLFPLAQRDLLAGASGAFDIFGGGIGQQQQALSQGNLNAQQTIGGGFGQVRNALLGLPVDQSGFAPQGVDFSQVPQNPFGVSGGLGSLGAGGTFTTGQGTFDAAPGSNRFLNPFASGADASGGLIRNPDGTLSVDFSRSQAPGSATAIAPTNALGALTFEKLQEDFRRLQNQQDNSRLGRVSTQI